MNTLLLAQNTWDLTIDAIGNIAVAQDPYATAQDCASNCRLFLGELWYDTTQGIPYFQQILGKIPALSLVKQLEQIACLQVNNVATATAFITSFSLATRILGGQVQLTLKDGSTAVIATGDLFSSTLPWYVSGASPVAAGDGGY